MSAVNRVWLLTINKKVLVRVQH
ncbi:hypothetical protein HID58_079960 [Brassica napus]|uniref:Uncharacterized protein n=1 Tax=Brassica napus TaxID=3708 RepID=A0ABQ7Y3H3_BRANA|nr:hypothetical protein HID58_079960 [Brassica napus]